MRFSIGDIIRQTQKLHKGSAEYFYFSITGFDQKSGMYYLFDICDGVEINGGYPLNDTAFYSFHKVEGVEDCL